jgi:hypothetical protein
MAGNTHTLQRRWMGASMSEFNYLTDCPCGYTLRAAKNILTQAEISAMMARHIEANHVVKGE